MKEIDVIKWRIRVIEQECERRSKLVTIENARLVLTEQLVAQAQIQYLERKIEELELIESERFKEL